MKSSIIVMGLMAVLCGPSFVYAGCGGTERWAVKVGADPGAANVDLNNIVPITVKGINELPNLQGNVSRGDNTTRLDAETVVYKVKGRLVLFKNEDDNDYHLVITDDSLKYTPGGKGTDGLETGTSFIAEIPDPDCVAGKKGDPSVPSRFAAQLKEVRRKFEERFPNGTGADTDLGGIPVTITGILFYDRPHNQTGRAVRGEELHPLLDISFDSDITPQPTSTTTTTETSDTTQLLANPGFEDGITGWSGTVDDIGSFENERAHRGDAFAWMGGTGTAHTERLYQNVSIPASANKATLSFWLRIDTEETTTSKANDKLHVQISDQNGKMLKTLYTYSNLDKNDDYALQSFDVSQFIGQDIRVSLKVIENTGKATSFKLDDFALTVQ